MSDLLIRADKFTSFDDDLRLRIAEGDNLVSELAARVRELEGKDHAKEIATGFYYWWHNQPGNNTQQGFDEYWRQSRMEELGVTEEDIAETKLPPTLDTIPEAEQVAEPTRPPRKPITLENLERDWLLGMTCHRHKRTVHWISDDGQWIVMKHHGHSEWVGGWDGNAYCGVYYSMFRVGDEFPDRLGKSPYFTQEGRWDKESMRWVEKVMAGWRPLNFVETQ